VRTSVRAQSHWLIDRKRDQGLARRARGEMAGEQMRQCIAKGLGSPVHQRMSLLQLAAKLKQKWLARSVKPARVPNHPIDNKRDGLAVGDTSMQQVY